MAVPFLDKHPLKISVEGLEKKIPFNLQSIDLTSVASTPPLHCNWLCSTIVETSLCRQ